MNGWSLPTLALLKTLAHHGWLVTTNSGAASKLAGSSGQPGSLPVGLSFKYMLTPALPLAAWWLQLISQLPQAQGWSLMTPYGSPPPGLVCYQPKAKPSHFHPQALVTLISSLALPDIATCLRHFSGSAIRQYSNQNNHKCPS